MHQLTALRSLHLNVSTLILGCRDIKKGDIAKKAMLKDGTTKTAADVRVWKLDMSDHTSVKAFAVRVDKELPRLDGLVANAGISTNLFKQAEGLEETLTVNVVSTFLLSLLCVPALRRTAEATGAPSHLVITGSNIHAFADPSEIVKGPNGKLFATLSDPKTANMNNRYFLSKLLVILCVRQLATHLGNPNNGIILNCPSPGWCKTPLFRQDDGGFWGRNMLRLIGRTADVGARCLTHAVSAGPETYGMYLSECRVKDVAVWVRSREGEETQRMVWDELVEVLREIAPEIGRVSA